MDEERALDLDVPEFVGLAPFVARPRSWSNAATAAAMALEKLIDVGVADPVDLPAFHFRADSLRVPVGRQANGDDDSAHPVWDGRLGLTPGPRLGKQRDYAASSVEPIPAKHAPPGVASRQCRLQATFGCERHRTHPSVAALRPEIRERMNRAVAHLGSPRTRTR